MVWINAELHSHSIKSDGSMSPKYLIKLTMRKGCKALAVTDHDTFKGSAIALTELKMLSPKEFVIIPSNEVRTSWGDILVYCTSLPNTEPPKDPFELRDWCNDNLCIMVPAHPTHPFRSSIGLKKLLEGKNLWDAIEIWNSRGLAIFNRPLIRIAKELNLPMTSGSDAHVPSEVCTSYTGISIEALDVEEIVNSIKKGKTKPTFGIENFRSRLESVAWAIERKISKPSNRGQKS